MCLAPSQILKLAPSPVVFFLRPHSLEFVLEVFFQLCDMPEVVWSRLGEHCPQLVDLSALSSVCRLQTDEFKTPFVRVAVDWRGRQHNVLSYGGPFHLATSFVILARPT